MTRLQHPTEITDIGEIDFTKLTDLILPTPVQYGDSVSGSVTSDTIPDQPVQITNISPVGVELVLPSSSVVEKGDVIAISLDLGGVRTINSGLIVDYALTSADEQRVTVRLIQPDSPQDGDEERRRSVRWNCDERFFPTAIASNPARFNDYIYFSIRDLSRTGARAVTSLRNKFVVRGMRLDCLVSFPMVSQVPVSLEVKNIAVTTERGKDLLSLGLEFVNPTPSDLSAIAQYLVQFSSTSSLKELRTEGLYPESVSQAVEYSFVRSEDELREVFALRTKTYAEVGKAETNEYLADSYDAKSRIVVGKYKGRIVTSARIFFPEYGDLLEQEEFVQLPNECSRRDDLVEVMRICTDPDFRHSDLLFSLFHFIGITCTQAKRHTIVGCATPDLVRIYTRIGFKDTGITYKHPLLNNKEHKLIITDTRRCILGVDVNPIVWNVLWRDTAKYLVDNDFLAQNTLSHMRLLLYKALAPLAIFAKRKSAKPRRNK